MAGANGTKAVEQPEVMVGTVDPGIQGGRTLGGRNGALKLEPRSLLALVSSTQALAQGNDSYQTTRYPTPCNS